MDPILEALKVLCSAADAPAAVCSANGVILFENELWKNTRFCGATTVCDIFETNHPDRLKSAGDFNYPLIIRYSDMPNLYAKYVRTRDTYFTVSLQKYTYSELLSSSYDEHIQLGNRFNRVVNSTVHRMQLNLSVLNRRLEEAGDTDSIAAAEHIFRELMVMTHMNRELTLLSDLENGRFKAHNAETGLKVYLQSVVNGCADLLKEQGIVLNADLTIDPLAVCRADQYLLNFLIVSLISNAARSFKDNADSKIIDITANYSNGLLYLSVSDNGVGMDDKQLEKAHAPFESGMEINSHIESVGLGLYICARLLNELNGKLLVSSTEGKGTNAVFTLPLAVSDKAETSFLSSPKNILADKINDISIHLSVALGNI